MTPDCAETELHLVGAFRILQAVLPRLQSASGSSLVLFSTVAVGTGFKFHFGKPEDIARIAAYLLSDDAGWITGQIFAVDGGISSLKI